jgi:chromosomal replication initiator protein
MNTTYHFIDDEVVNKTILWEEMCKRLEHQIGIARMTSTFSRAIPLGITDEGEFIIGVPNAFNHSVITTMHLEDMNALTRDISGYELTCTAILDPNLATLTERKTPLELMDPPVMVETKPAKKPSDTNMFDPKYTFDSFISGESNDLAYSASLSVAEAPGLKYNPLFIWGGPGLGKTHLLQAIGSYISQCYPNKKIIYTPLETLLNKFLESLRNEDMSSLRNNYRTTDVLIIDDIQFLQGKKAMTDFVFHTFNSLEQQHKQIIFAADRSPDQLDLEERVTSRFKAGMLADIQLPTYETRMAILQQYIKSLKIEFTPESIAYIAEKSSGNIREMEGVGTRVGAYAELRHIQTVDLAFVKSATVGLFPEPNKKPISVETIIKETCGYYHLQKSDLLGTNRKQDITHARHVAMYLCQEMTDSSYPAIGKAFGGKDHTTVLHAVNKIKKRMGADREMFNQIRILTDQINKRSI